MLPKDARRFPREEAYISDFFDRIIYGEVVFPKPVISPRRCPNVTGPGWFKCNGLIDYHLRRNVWALYARSGERKYFEYGERFNRFAGDMVMHHWDTAGQAGLGRFAMAGIQGGNAQGERRLCLVGDFPRC